jgi:hypothetical protein
MAPRTRWATTVEMTSIAYQDVGVRPVAFGGDQWARRARGDGVARENVVRSSHASCSSVSESQYAVASRSRRAFRVFRRQRRESTNHR